MKTNVFDIENWKEIGATLARNKTRTFLTAFGIFWGTAMLAMLMGGAQGLKDMLMMNFDGFATNTAVIFPGRLTVSYKGFNKGTIIYPTTIDAELIRANIPEFEAVSSVQTSSITAAYQKKHTTATLSGADEYYSRIFLPIIYQGRFINAADSKNERKICVLGKRVAGDLFGSESPLGKYVNISGIYYKVVGVAGQTSEVQIGDEIDESIIIPASTMQKALNTGNDVDGLMMLARNGISPSSLLGKIEHEMRKNHPISPDDHNAFFFFDVSEQFKMVDNLFLGVNILALFVGFGSLLAGIIGVGNIMWVIVKERTQEIGIRRAIGATPADIVTQILSEGVLLTLVAGVGGIVFAAIALYVTQMLTANEVAVPRFQLEFATAVEILLTFAVLGTAAGLIPALKAMKIKPVEAMNDK